jgi:hypothetical protein
MPTHQTAALQREPHQSRQTDAGQIKQLAPDDLLRKGHNEILDKVLLLGQPSLNKYLRFVRDRVEGGAGIDRGGLVAEWRRANDYYRHLEESETGAADEIAVRAIDPRLDPLIAEAQTNPHYRYAFRTLPSHFAMVELDRLVLFQTQFVQQGVDRLMARLGPRPAPEKLLHFCLPPDVPDAPVKIRKVGSERYIFSCESTDLRMHNQVILGPDQILNHETFGPISGVVGLVVGFGSNFLTGVRWGNDGRVLLKNGYHRVCALRSLGITHAPCIIQTAANRDELKLAATSKVADDLEFYFESARPPLLKDFFDPNIRKVHKVYKTLKMIEIEFEVREHYVEA